MHRPKHCEYNNEVEENYPDTINYKNNRLVSFLCLMAYQPL